MSGSFPTSPPANQISVKSVTPTLVSVTHSLKRQVRARGGQRWLLDVNFPPMTRAEFQPIWAFSVKQQGQYESFTFTPPIVSQSSGGVVTHSVTTSSAAIGATSVTIASLSGTLKAGDFIKFSGHDKVYMLTADCASASSIAIEPALVAAVAGAETITWNSVPIKVAFASDLREFSTGAGKGNNILFSYSMSLIETP